MARTSRASGSTRSPRSYYGEPGLWRVIAVYNGIADPLQIPPPRILRIPPASAIRALA